MTSYCASVTPKRYFCGEVANSNPIVALAIVFLIYRSEARSRRELQAHIDGSNNLASELRKDISEIKKMLMENGKSTLRIEINEEMLQNPHNQDTILKMAVRSAHIVIP